MKTTLTFDFSGIKQNMKNRKNILTDLKLPLQHFGNYMISRSHKRFDAQGPGWPNRKEASVESAVRRSLHSLERKLYREKSRAVKRELKNPTKRNQKVTAEQRRAVALGALHSILAGDAPVASPGLNQKAIQKLTERVQEYRTKPRATQELGNIKHSMRSTVGPNFVIIESKIPWAGVHNKGGDAGHGAHEPKREFLPAPTEEDMDILKLMIMRPIIAAK